MIPSPSGLAHLLPVLLLLATLPDLPCGPSAAAQEFPTIVPDFSCMPDTIQPGTNTTFRIQLRGCLPGVENDQGFLHLDVWPADADTDGTHVEKSLRWGYGFGAEVKLDFNMSGNGNRTIPWIADGHFLPITIPIDKHSEELSWFANLVTTANSADIVIKAWCSDTQSCVQNCSAPSALCVGPRTCRCVRASVDTPCTPDVEPIPPFQNPELGGVVGPLQFTIGPGVWKFYSFEVPDGHGRFLVEISRAYGDVALFLKPGNPDLPFQSLPSESDLDGYSDKLSYLSRLSHHHLNGTGAGRFHVGILNSNTCVQQSAQVNLTIWAASLSSDVALCPLNCSYPNGLCVQDGVCQCEDDYGGHFCESSVHAVKPQHKVNGTLHPGQAKYLRLQASDFSDYGNISISFSRSGGCPVLVAQTKRFPTLTDYYLRFSTSTAMAIVSEEYELDPSLVSQGDLILGVFNVDYAVHEDVTFEIFVGFYSGRGARALSTWMILLVALMSSMFVCLSMGICKTMVNHRRDVRDTVEVSNATHTHAESLVGTEGLDKTVLETFPLLVYREGILGKEETQCPICLNDYAAAEVLCAVPVCTHIFHVHCIKKWLRSNFSCPLCRISLQHIPLTIPEDWSGGSSPGSSEGAGLVAALGPLRETHVTQPSDRANAAHSWLGPHSVGGVESGLAESKRSIASPDVASSSSSTLGGCRYD